VVVTGVGLVSPLGNTPAEYWRRLMAGTTAVEPVTRFDASRFACRLAAEVGDCELPAALPGAHRHEMKRLDRFVRYALAATCSALTASRFPLARLAAASGEAERGAIFLGVSMGGLGSLENGILRQESEGPGATDPYLISASVPNMAAGMVALSYGFSGPQYTLVGGCSSGIQAVGAAFEAIRAGRLSWALAGGAEAVITPITFSGFQAMGLLSRTDAGGPPVPRPFDRDRNGMIVGEGAGMLVLESRAAALARGAPILAEIGGYATSSVTRLPFFSCSDTTARCMELAIADAGLAPPALDFIYAHAGGLAGDAGELAAVQRIWNGGPRRPALTSVKGHIGYAFGAGGPLDLIAAVTALEKQEISPTLNFATTEPEFSQVDVVAGPRSGRLRAGLVNSFGLGGVNACLLVTEAAR
jgi:3-oxoacyl-[acyl-carrier-protein] synthase II